MNHIILLFYIRNNSIFVGLWKKRQILHLPFVVFLIIIPRIAHFYKMSYTPGNDVFTTAICPLSPLWDSEYVRILSGN